MADVGMIERIVELERRLAALESGEERVSVEVSTANVSNPPTDAELDSEFGAPADVGAGAVFVLDDNGGGSNVYLVLSLGANGWWFEALTQAA